MKIPSGGRGPDNVFLFVVLSHFLSYQRISQRAVQISLEKQLDPSGPIASPRGSVPEFLRKPIATCDFSEVHNRNTIRA